MKEAKRNVKVYRKVKGRRRRVSAGDAPPAADAGSNAKKVVLRRLFGRVRSVDRPNVAPAVAEPRPDTPPPEPAFEEPAPQDENDDPLLDSVPENLDPEQLGFLVCAQETLRYLHRMGLSMENEMFVRLRSRFLRGLSEMGLA